MNFARDVLTPDALSMLQTISRLGSFAAAARDMGLVPSALSYRVRQMEDTLDVLLFDRSSRQARLTAAGQELISEGMRLLNDMDSIAHRIKRVATGWESQFTIAVDTVINHRVVMDLCQHFYDGNPPTRLRLKDEALSGSLYALTSGQADLAIGVGVMENVSPGLRFEDIGPVVKFVFAVAPMHPLASAVQPLSDAVIRAHRAVAVADSIPQGNGITIGLLAGQDVFTVPSMSAKLDAQLRGMGAGFLPEPMARPYIERGELVACQVLRPQRSGHIGYAWRQSPQGQSGPNGERALQWWLTRLSQPQTRQALLGQSI
ncbi:MAG: LysR family transcriptional regulator [Burkholderiales bacterium]|nr:LysR family transcriptional regulator [Burkholderiales bacterium]